MPIHRRDFLGRSATAGLLAGGLTVLPNAASAAAAPAAEKVHLAVLGIRSRGHVLATALAQRPDCRVGWLCDADSALFESRAENVAKAQGGPAPKCAQDFRRALDDKSVDALVVATPDHWHGLATVWACQARKDVFVAAPLGHNPWEGRKMVETARKHNRIVQVDLDSRSGPSNESARKYIAEGKLGKVHLCRVIEQKGQANFPAKPDAAVPKGLDWDAWNGPAPESKYNDNLRDNWHGYWRYSGGDMAVEGVHVLDLARWLCGLEYPKTVQAVGGRFNTQGANQTPDTLTAVYEFDKLMMNFELTLYTPYMIKISPAVRNGDNFPYWPQCGTRIEIYGSEGVMMAGPHGCGWQVFTRPRREQFTEVDHAYGKLADPLHQENFLQSVRTRKPPAADVEEGHRSTLLVHYANMSVRTGGLKLVIDPKTEQVDGAEAMKFFKREYRKPWVME
jgi:predicted dehydrogenase